MGFGVAVVMLAVRSVFSRHGELVMITAFTYSKPKVGYAH